MTDQRDPQIMALIVELAESSPSAPSFTELEEMLEPIGPEPVRPLRRPTAARKRPAWLVGVAAAVAVLLVVGGLAWLVRTATQDSPVITDPPTPTVTLPETTSTTEPPAPEGAGNWMRIEDPDAFPQRAEAQSPVINSIVIGGPGLVAVGRDITAPRSDETQSTAPTTVPPGSPGDTAAVWISTDGIEWARVPHDESVFGGPEDQVMNDVVAGGPGLVAVGQSVDVKGDNPGPTVALVWTSPDGVTWSRVHEDPSGSGMSAVTVGGPGLVAVGSDEFGAAVWTSTDGIGWSRYDVFRGATMNDVTVGPLGLVAVGGGEGECFDPIEIRSDGQENCGSVVWTSADGVNWTRAYSDEGADIKAVAQARPGLVAVGWGGAVWTSPDGTTWTRQPTDEQTFAGASHRLQEIASGGLGVIVVAQAGFPGPSALWTSADGVTWSRIHEGFSLDPGSYMNDMIGAEAGLVVVGSAETDLDPGPDSRSVGSAAVWILTEGG